MRIVSLDNYIVKVTFKTVMDLLIKRHPKFNIKMVIQIVIIK